MNSLKPLSLILISLLVLSSCVPKKKYLEMVAAKEKFEDEANKMKVENQGLVENLKQSEVDYRNMKDYLYASDATKNDKLNKLSNQLDEIEASYNLIKADLDKTKDLFKDQRYFSAKASSEIARLEIEIKQLARDTASLNHSIKLARARVDEYRGRSQERLDMVTAKNLEIDDLNTTIKGKAEEIETLQSDITAEKEKVKKINDAFIALRRQLVKGKSSGTPVDPNANANIDKISKALGHY